MFFAAYHQLRGFLKKSGFALKTNLPALRQAG
jgi:hypothetical protein